MAANYSTIEQALEELRAGHLIMVIDDPDREPKQKTLFF